MQLAEFYRKFYKDLHLDIRANFGKYSGFRCCFYFEYRFFALFRLTSNLYHFYGDCLVTKIINRVYVRHQRQCSVELPYKLSARAPIRIPHLNTIVINENTIIGKCVTILPMVTIGNVKSKGLNNCAVIGSYCSLGSGCKIIGPVSIPAFCEIGANAVVSKSLHQRGVYVGIPVKKIK
jgi:serine acetyltransferase